MKKKVQFNEGILGEFLSKHDMIFEKPPKIWDNGVPLGNSTAGAMVWGEKEINVTLDRADLWEIRRYEPDKNEFTWRKYCSLMEKGELNDFGIFGQRTPGPTPQRLPIGRFSAKLSGKELLDYRMRLSIYDAVVSGYCTTELGTMNWSCYVSADAPVIVFRYKVDGGERADISFKFVSELGAYAQDKAEVEKTNYFRTLREFKFVQGYEEGLPELAQILRDWGYPEPTRSTFNGISVFEQKIPENGDFAVAWVEMEMADKERVLIVSLVHDRKNGESYKEAINIVKQLQSAEKLDLNLSSHKRWWHQFYPDSFFSFPDTRMEALYWMEMYKLGCTARPDAIAPPAGGPWTTDDGLPVFVCGGYYWNQQQQGILMPIYTANRLEYGKSSYELLKNGRQEMRDYCKNFFECDGEFLPHITTLDGKAINNNPDQFEFLSGPWMCQFMWLHYKYSMDKNFLENTLYPMMREQIKPIMHNLIEGEDGKLHLPWTMSAEYQGEQESYRWSLGLPTDWSVRYGPDATSDIGYLRFLCEALLESVETLEIDDADRKKWETVLENLVPFQLDKFGGLMVRGDLALESSHRHLSHLFPIHHLHQIDYETPEGKSIIEKSLYVLKLRGSGEWMGWTFSEAAKICILAHQPARARMLLLEMVDKVVHENTCDLEGTNHDCGMTMHGDYGLTLEGDGMFASALQDFAVRSFKGTIYVMDVLPDAWENVSFYHFRTEGAFLVSAQRRNGYTEFISIESEAGGKVRLVSEFGKDVCVQCEGTEIETEFRDGRVMFDTKIGKEYIIYETGNEPKNTLISPVEDKYFERNFFGIKKVSRY